MSVSATPKNWHNQDLFSPIVIRTPQKQAVKKRRSYSPSWMKKTEMRREHYMSKSYDPFSPKPSDIVAGLAGRNFQSSKHINSTIRHELLEQQYQDLRKLMVERNEQSKPGKGTSRQRQSDPSLAVSSGTLKTNKSAKSTISTQSDFVQKESISVRDFLQSNEYGSDHFSKHLSCVKKLAKRYRRHRIPHKFKAVIEIIE